MRKIIILLIALSFLSFVIFLFVRNPDLFKQIYLWLIGLFGIIAWPIKRVWDWLTSNNEVKEIEQSNLRLKQDLAQIKKELVLAQQKLEEERRKNKVRIAELNAKIASEDEKGNAIKNELDNLKNQPTEKFRELMRPDEREQLLDNAWKEIDFGLQ